MLCEPEEKNGGNGAYHLCVCVCERFCIQIHQNVPDANVSVTPGALSPLLQQVCHHRLDI